MMSYKHYGRFSLEKQIPKYNKNTYTHIILFRPYHLRLVLFQVIPVALDLHRRALCNSGNLYHVT
jgi:hypothetical protein